MNTVIFDFDRISSMDDFFALAKNQLQLPEYFGNNLDALWDSISGDISLPIKIEFIHLSINQLEVFSDLIILMEDAVYELEPEFSFTYSLKK